VHIFIKLIAGVKLVVHATTFRIIWWFCGVSEGELEVKINSRDPTEPRRWAWWELPLLYID
jgi:hypothetical protein